MTNVSYLLMSQILSQSPLHGEKTTGQRSELLGGKCSGSVNSGIRQHW